VRLKPHPLEARLLGRFSREMEVNLEHCSQYLPRGRRIFPAQARAVVHLRIPRLPHGARCRRNGGDVGRRRLGERITLLNVDESPEGLPSRFSYIQGDGRDTRLPDAEFDLAFSNSAIEHVGNFDDQRRFANEVLRVGRRIYCQTPNKWFPVEPHFLGVFVHWLPRKWFTHFVDRYLTLHGWRYKPDAATSAALIGSIRLLTRTELMELFPGCKIRTEWCLGLPKSFVVWK
jgi:SAM-dependent methyltransferase